MVAANVVVAEREADARRLFNSLQQLSLYTLRGSPVALPQPVDDLKRVASAAEIEAINHMFTYSFVGPPETLTSELQGFLKMTRADELIVSNPILDHAARLRSLELTALTRDSERSGQLKRERRIYEHWLDWTWRHWVSNY